MQIHILGNVIKEIELWQKFIYNVVESDCFKCFNRVMNESICTLDEK